MTSSEATRYDAVVIGGGHNGIVAATVLAKSGRKALLVEAANELGGAARTHEFTPGFRASMAHVLNRLHPEVIAALDLGRHGLNLTTATLAPSIALTTDDGPLTLNGAYGEVLIGATAAEARAWQGLRAQL